MAYYREHAAHNWTEDSVRLIVSPSQFAKTSFFYVEEAGYFRTQPGYFTEREQLNSFLIAVTHSGTGFLTFKGKKYMLKENEAFFIHCMEYQYYETDETDLWEFSWVHLNGAAINGYYQYFQLAESPVVTLKNPETVKSTLQQLLQLHRKFNPFSEPLSSKLLTDLLTEFLYSANDPQTAGAYVPDTMKAIMRYLEHHFNEPVSLDRLAELFNISKYHLAKEFKKYSGLTPNEFLISCRITYAKNSLKYTNQPVADIAEEAGIPNVSHFINLFKQREGSTPLAFRKNWQRPK
ncbi:AraC family transcriptional regulator [Planococcus shixiaomingii]|uniref:AraC family transcriptional regulator n=1 Tax=Planococcus shixiaomingii TaxID=3058393 RepID=UPI002639415E|nr:AraC family transcriptional regulator [Planococcus sp. N022]WKA54410.1 AraC family transcriptional regulator [Planococcus sp. N022]